MRTGEPVPDLLTDLWRDGRLERAQRALDLGPREPLPDEPGAEARDEDGNIASVAYGALHERMMCLNWVVTEPASAEASYRPFNTNG